MLPPLGNGIICITLLLITDITANTYSDHGDFLSRLLTSKNGPVVVFLESDQLNQDFSSNSITEDAETQEYMPPPGEHDAYLLYSVLRSTQEGEDLDSKAARTFEMTKDLLRSAFALRCQKKDACQKKCPKKREEGCQMNCKKVFDELDACDEKPACQKKQTCGEGHTMPPKWLRILTG